MLRPCDWQSSMIYNPFTKTGALAQGDPLFRGRAAELALLERACVSHYKSFLLVYGGRQNGKTSLLLRLEASLRQRLPERVRVCRVDFQNVPDATTETAFQYLIAELRSNLPHLPPATAGAGIPDLRGFMEQALAGDEVVRLVLLLDELARLPTQTRENLAHVIRALHTHRLVSPALAKTQFVLAGGLELYDLAIVQASTLRNVCEIVRLGDLSEAEAVALIGSGLALAGVNQTLATALGKAVYTRVSGHPYLTQRVGGLLAERQLRGDPLDEDLVEELCWELLDGEDALLEHLRRSIAELHLESAARRLLTARQRTSTTDDNTARLELLGLARRAGRHWAPRSPLLGVALAEWLRLGLTESDSLITAAQMARQKATERYLSNLRLEQVATASHAERAATPAEQVRLQRQANELAEEIARLEAVQRPMVDARHDKPLPTPAAPEKLLAQATRASTPSVQTPPPAPARRNTGHTPRPLPAWVPTLIHIPAGRFLMGSSDNDKQADGDEKPQHSLTLPGYWIGKTPVTNAQFRPFVEGDGYRNQQFWTQAGWKWREEAKIIKPEYWENQNWNGSDYPVVGVSWFEAVAYCRWLSAQTGHAFRLPSEAEWEKAARGPKGLIWPWGNTWQAECCNSKEAGNSRITPVGQYPNGASPYGVLDIAGNVCEWVATAWEKRYPYQFEDEWRDTYLELDGTRVFRGGSWAHDQKGVRGACRNYDAPHDRFFLQIGLRVACHSPLPGSES